MVSWRVLPPQAVKQPTYHCNTTLAYSTVASPPTGGARLICAMNFQFGNGRAINYVVTMTNFRPLTRYYDIQS
jgi:hypothetical protein